MLTASFFLAWVRSKWSDYNQDRGVTVWRWCSVWMPVDDLYHIPAAKINQSLTLNGTDEAVEFAQLNGWMNSDIFMWLNEFVPVSTAERSETSTVFSRSNFEIGCSNPARGMDVCLRFAVLCCPVYR